MLHPRKVNFFFSYSTSLSYRTELKAFIEKIFRREGKSLVGLNYVFCSDKELLRINKEYLGHDYFTDIITFDLSDSTKKIQAEIYISVERVKENAAQFGTSFKQELHRVIFHGVLHLCGYADKSKKSRLKMRERENFYLNHYFR